jgi:hypothetical protein
VVVRSPLRRKRFSTRTMGQYHKQWLASFLHWRKGAARSTSMKFNTVDWWSTTTFLSIRQ